MTRGWSSGGAAAIALVLAAGAPRAEAAERDGAVLGFVEDTRGTPVPGALISLFGSGLAGGAFTTFSDSTGRFFLPSLPAGSYTLRALRTGQAAAAARRVTVLPNQDATFTISLAGVGESSSDAAATATDQDDRDPAEAERELRWLLRHRRRSALEDRGAAPAATNAAAAPEAPRLLASLVRDLAGSLEVVSTPLPLGDPFADDAPTSLSLVRLRGRIAESGRWSIGGLVAERDGTAWRMAGEFVFEPLNGHEVRASTGYGTGALRPVPFTLSAVRLQDRGVGAVSVQDRWQVADRLALVAGGRYSYAGFLADSNHLEPMAAIEVQRDARTRVRAAMVRQTVLPGGDVLNLSTLSPTSSTAFAVLDEALRAEQLDRYELAVDQDLGGTTVQAATFFEKERDPLVQRFSLGGAGVRVENSAAFAARGMGVKVSHKFGHAVEGSMRYTFGHGWRRDVAGAEPILAWREGDFHDVSARVETFVQETDTRLVAYWRVNRVAGEDVPAALTNTRFDVQLSQGLPFLGGFTRANWDVLVAVRNLFYDEGEGGVLDEMVVTNPPTRVVGGISVRF